MKAVLISIQPKWVEKIANGEKTIEVRKTKPKLETPFKVYIYATWGGSKKEILVKQDGLLYCEDWRKANGLQRASGKVIGEFVCDRIDEYIPFEAIEIISKYEKSIPLLKESCLTLEELGGYIGNNNADKNFYGWHITDLKIYDKPKELSDFRKPCPYTDGTYCIENKCEYYGDWTGVCHCWVERPPQSWCYVET